MSENRGPKIENLRKAMQMFPAMARKLEDQKAGKPTASRKPTKMCAVCCLAFDFQITVNTGLEESLCNGCKEKLQLSEERQENGVTKTMRCAAFIYGELYAFVVSSGLGEMAGKIVEVTEIEMNQIAQQFKIQKRVKDGIAKTSEDRFPPVVG